MTSYRHRLATVTVRTPATISFKRDVTPVNDHHFGVSRPISGAFPELSYTIFTLASLVFAPVQSTSLGRQ